MISVRDSNYKIMDNSIYIGVELEAKGKNYYKDNSLCVKFYNNNELVKEDNSWDIPYIVGEGIIYVGNKYDEDIKFTDIKVEFILGEEVYEKTNFDKVAWSFDKTDGKKLVYKFNNHSGEEIEYAILNLVFYNKGKLVCGDSIRQEKLLNERIYYFEYDVPENLEYTEVFPFFLLANTNYYLFNDFYKEYKNYNKKLKEIKNDYRDYEYNDYSYDETKRYNDNLKMIEKNFSESLKKKKKSIKELVTSIIILLILLVLIRPGITSIILFFFNLFNADAPFTWAVGVPYLIVLPFSLVYLIKLIKNSIDIGKTLSKGTKSVKQAKKELEDYKIKLEEDKKKAVEKSDIITKKNAEIEKYNEKIRDKNTVMEKEYNSFINKYSEYDIRFITEEDISIIEDAISAGAILYDEVLNYYKGVKEEQTRIEALKEKERKENERQAEIISHLKDLEEELAKSTSVLRDQLIENSYENARQMQNALDQYAYISKAQSDAQIKAVNKLNSELKKQTHKLGGIYNDVHY